MELTTIVLQPEKEYRQVWPCKRNWE